RASPQAELTCAIPGTGLSCWLENTRSSGYARGCLGITGWCFHCYLSKSRSLEAVRAHQSMCRAQIKAFWLRPPHCLRENVGTMLIPERSTGSDFME
ncbi:mCG1030636, isoform CRA_a, partial [Mus musculus]